MKLILISDSFKPEPNAAGVLMYDLNSSFAENGYETVLATSVPLDVAPYLSSNTTLIQSKNCRLRSNRYFLRLISEIMASLIIGIKIRISPKTKNIDNIIIYSPSIFWIITLLCFKKKRHRVILVLRDLFPLWLLAIKLLSANSLRYRFLNYFASMLYRNSNYIMVQSRYDRTTLLANYDVEKNKVQILENWMDDKCVPDFCKADKYIQSNMINLIYLGNFGKAQNSKFAMQVIKRLVQLSDRVIVNLVGLKTHDSQAASTFFKDEIDACRINLIQRCSHEEAIGIAIKSDFGLISLANEVDRGNMPGKFITYTMAGLPTLALCSRNTTIAKRIIKYSLGVVIDEIDETAAAQNILESLTSEFNRLEIKKYFKSHHDVCSAFKTISNLCG